ncbi:hypothetical protein VOLCADRAFT_115617 [Volvox carteri f. nagariensis]|uniref:UspA domain-containing protein n=1 Tax=Volvox carteri f. nagariensis TaxID=3068 RepID=D8TH74_VOLCA|nr:uncharacterized protein VOLCADRAFT_115617 [Volvox carteri f. nagariensis]EFJ53021.1 hypothetical protein VOLCADRAFT_115617 [Volvox carteri f. nagariensis]|eukprot:XP_002946026.1 hypothetical protein VOLCADRAFT_115617 [Volvox carteri f. nagariensis]
MAEPVRAFPWFVIGGQPRSIRSPPQPGPAAAVAGHRGVLPTAGYLHWRLRRRSGSSVVPPLAATDPGGGGGGGGGTAEEARTGNKASRRRANPVPAPSSSPSSRNSASSNDADASRPPPTGMSAGGGGRSQSERAATAAAEATVAETEAWRRQQQNPQTQPQSQLKSVSDFRTSDRIAEALNAAAAAATEEAPLHPHASGSIEVLRTHPHEFTCNEPNTCGGTILVALDDTDDAAAAVEWVAKNLYHPGVDELRVVHVVCDPRTLQWQTSLGTTASGRSIADYLSRLQAAAGRVVDRRCEQLHRGGVKYEVELPRLSACRSAAGIGETLLDAVRRYDAKLLVVASHGPGALAEYGSVSRFCYQHSHVPLLLVPSIEAQAAAAAAAARRAAAVPLAPPPPPAAAAASSGALASEGAAAAATAPAAAAASTRSEILLVVNHLEELASVWQWVADNCARKGDALSIWHVAGPSLSGMPSLSTAIANQLQSRGLGQVSYRQLYSSTGDPQDLGDQVRHGGEG